MKRFLLRSALIARRGLKAIADNAIGWLAVGLLHAIRRGDRTRMANRIGGFMRRAGPWLPKHRVGRKNLAAAFPEKSAAEIEQILGGVWDNLGRLAVEFAVLDRMKIMNPSEAGPADYVVDPRTIARIEQIRSAQRPIAVFAAHLANWELPAISTARLGIQASVLYRPPNIRPVADAVLKMRTGRMGTLVRSGFDAPIRLANALGRGEHVAMLVDQHESRGVDVTFFGRTCKASPLIGQLARHTGCDVRGIRSVRLPDGNHFWGEITEPLDLPRDAKGLIDVQGATQAIATVIEGWVREHPEQWLWLHRRWR